MCGPVTKDFPSSWGHEATITNQGCVLEEGTITTVPLGHGGGFLEEVIEPGFE